MRKSPTTERPGEELLYSYDNTLAVDGSKKRYCVGCGGMRDVVYAETVPCGCCGSTGTQKTIPEFDPETNELLPAGSSKKTKAPVKQHPAQFEIADVPYEGPLVVFQLGVSNKPQQAALKMAASTPAARQADKAARLAAMFGGGK